MSIPVFLSSVFRPDKTFQVERKPGRLSGKDLPGFPYSNVPMKPSRLEACPTRAEKPGRLSGISL